MKVYGRIDMKSNQIKNFAVDIIETNQFPDPYEGRLIYRKDLGQLFLCVQTFPSIVWLPILSKTSTHLHEQTIVSNEWLITHEMNTENVFVQVYNIDGHLIVPHEIIILNNQQVKILFSENIAGKALIASLNDVSRLQKTSLEIPFTLTKTLNINHGFGYYPHVTILNNEKTVVIPDKINHINKNEVFIDFGDVETAGVAIIG